MSIANGRDSRRKPRVLFLINHAGAGGTERDIETLVEKLVPEEIEALLVYHEDGPLRKRLEARGVPCFHIRLGIRFDVRAAHALARLCRTWKVDVLHTMFLREHYLSWLSGFLGNRARRMGTVHLMLEHPARPPLLWMDRAVYHGMNALIAVCEALAIQLRAAYGLRPDQLHVIHNGVVPSVASDDAKCENRWEVRREFGFSQEDVVFLSAGRLCEEKGFSFLFEAISRWQANPSSGTGKARNVRFLIAGDGPLREELQQAAEAVGLPARIVFAGYRQDLPRLLDASDAYVSASRTEALSLSILEAMEAGLPIVATEVGGTPEMIRAEWENGMLVPYGDTERLADAIEKLAMDRPARIHMGENAAKIAHTRFSLEKMVRGTFDLYTTLGRTGKPMVK